MFRTFVEGVMSYYSYVLTEKLKISLNVKKMDLLSRMLNICITGC